MSFLGYSLGSITYTMYIIGVRRLTDEWDHWDQRNVVFYFIFIIHSSVQNHRFTLVSR